MGVIGQFTDGARLYDNFKAGSSSRTFTLNTRFPVYGQIATKRLDGTVVVPGPLPEYECSLAKITTFVNSAGDTEISTFRGAGVYATSPTTSATALTSAEVNAFYCYGVGVVGRLLGTQLDDGMSRLHSMFFIPQADGSYKYIHSMRKRSFDQTGIYPDPTTGFTTTADGAPRFGRLTAVKKADGNYSSFNLTGQLTPGIKMLKLRTVAERAKFSHEDISLTLNTVEAATSSTLQVSGSIKLVNADGSTASDMQITPGSTLSAKTDIVKVIGGACAAPTFIPATSTTVATFTPGTTVPGTCTNITGTVSELSAMNMGVSVSMPNAKFEGTIAAGSASFDVTGMDFTYQPNSVVLNGKIYEGDGAGGYRLFLDGKVTAANTNYSSVNTSLLETATNFLKKQITFDGKILLKDRPDMSLTLAAQNSSPTASTMTGNFTWDGGWGFNFAVAKDTAANTGAVTFTSLSGVTFTLPKNSSTIKQPIYKNGVLMGYFTLSTKRIDYTDGSFEQF